MLPDPEGARWRRTGHPSVQVSLLLLIYYCTNVRSIRHPCLKVNQLPLDLLYQIVTERSIRHPCLQVSPLPLDLVYQNVTERSIRHPYLQVSPFPLDLLYQNVPVTERSLTSLYSSQSTFS